MGVPVVNIGSCQLGRERGCNTIDVESDKTAIMNTVYYWLSNDKPEQSFVYGNGEAGKRMAEVLATVPLR